MEIPQISRRPPPNQPPPTTSDPPFLSQGCRSSLLAARFAILERDAEGRHRVTRCLHHAVVELPPSLRLVGASASTSAMEMELFSSPQPRTSPPRWLGFRSPPTTARLRRPAASPTTPKAITIAMEGASCGCVCVSRRSTITMEGRPFPLSVEAITIAMVRFKKSAARERERDLRMVQQEILQSDIQSKMDKTPVTVADYGSQVLVSLVLSMEVTSGSFSMVAEEDSEKLRKDGAEEILERITDLVNETLAEDGSYNILLSKEAVLSAIDTGKSEGGSSGRHWVLDPIDGTKGFVRGDQYAIALALLDEGRVVLGVLGCPNLPLTSISNLSFSSSGDHTGALFSATIGCGAEVQSLDGSSPQKISVCTIDNPVNASFFESYEGAHTMRDFTGSIAEKLGVQAPPLRIDSQAKYGALARGDGAIYWRFPHYGYRETIWDHAASSIVVTEAGGVVKDASGNDLDFSKGRFLERDTGIIATNKQLMPSAVDAIIATNKQSFPLSVETIFSFLFSVSFSSRFEHVYLSSAILCCCCNI